MSFFLLCTKFIRTTNSIIGLSDGLTVPFALTAGLSSLGTSRIVVLGGVAELIAGAISMGIGGFLASQAERDHFRFLRKQTSARVAVSCAGEMEREVEEILGPLGIDEKACRAVAESLRKAGAETNEEASSADDLRLKWSNGVGLTAFLLKFGEGMGGFTYFTCHLVSNRFVNRGGPHETSLHLRIHNRHGIPHRRPNSSFPLLLHPTSSNRFNLLVYRHRHCAAYLWSH